MLSSSSNLEISKGKINYDIYYDLNINSFLIRKNKGMPKKINIPFQSKLTLS